MSAPKPTGGKGVEQSTLDTRASADPQPSPILGVDAQDPVTTEPMRTRDSQPAPHVTQRMPHHYTAYGLSIASEIECPELIGVAPSARADVTISLAEVPERIDAPHHVTRRVQIGAGVFQFEPRRRARYRVVGGHSILVHPLPGASPEEIRLFLLGTAFGILLHQRGLLPLHASAIKRGRGAIAFCGPSGAGKSTLAAALHRHGYDLLCDDIGVVVPDPVGPPLFYPGFPRVKLWRDALKHFDLDPHGLARDWVRAEKYHLHLTDSFHRRPLPLQQIHFLERSRSGEPASVVPLEGVRGIPLLVANTYRAGQVRRMGDFHAHFQRCAQIAESVSLYRYARPWALDRLGESVDLLIGASSPEGQCGGVAQG